mgnify:FL=1
MIMMIILNYHSCEVIYTHINKDTFLNTEREREKKTGRHLYEREYPANDNWYYPRLIYFKVNK